MLKDTQIIQSLCKYFSMIALTISKIHNALKIQVQIKVYKYVISCPNFNQISQSFIYIYIANVQH